MDDFASTALYDLIASRLRARGMDVQPSNRFEGKTERAQKADLLSDALGSLGASAIVDIGQGIQSADSDPTLAVLVRADTAGELLERWQRLERYYHGKHRVRIVNTAPASMVLEHYSTQARQPSAGEDLVIAGVMAALLQRVGCRTLSLAIGEPETRFIEDDVVLDIRAAPQTTASWHFWWQSFEKQHPHAGARKRSGSTAQQLSQLIEDDLGRNWRLGAAAEMLGTSTRTLQRSLARDGTSFQQLLRTVRTERSAKLISANDCKLVEAGYACGFSDQAHFSRDFKLRFNMSPSQFAEIATAP